LDFIDVINTRNSVRKYDAKPVEDEKINEILECARLAPSWANKQGWHFIVIKNPEKVAALTKAAGLVNRWLKNVPAMIVACGDPGQSGHRAGIEYIYIDVAIAMEHLVLAANNLGLGTCWIGYFDEEGIKKELGIPDDIRVIVLTPLGYPAEKRGTYEKAARFVMGSKKRKEIDEIVHQETW
jgi:nitroreductase